MINYIGMHFQQYGLDMLLGRGGFADVYRAWDDHLNRLVAIKVLRRGVTNRELLKFSEEARIMARLRHPNIITVFEFNYVKIKQANSYQKIPYFVMDYASNGSLADRHPHGEVLDLDSIIYYLEEIVDALEYIHNHCAGGGRLVHQDIKPANVLLGAHDEILISDFGIARFVQSTRLPIVPPSDQEWFGTAMYAAPERFRGRASPATDQYALGIMLYEWLTGTYPFHGTTTEIIQQHITMLPPPLRTISSNISSDVEKIVLKALSKNPYARFRSVRELLSAMIEARHRSFPRSLISFLRGGS